MKKCGVCGGRDERVWGLSEEKCEGDKGKCVGETGCVEKCGVVAGKCVGLWGEVKRIPRQLTGRN